MKYFLYILMVISLLFGCKAMDYTLVKENDEAVQIQYYNVKPHSIEIYTELHKIQNIESFNYIIKGDTLYLYFVKKAITYRIVESDSMIRTCRGNGIVIIEGIDIRNPRNKRSDYLTVPPHTFYEVNFPILEIENVAREDLGKWYRSFSTIEVFISRGNEEIGKYSFHYPKNIFSSSNYTRPRALK